MIKNEYKLHGDNGPLIVIENGLGNSMYGWYKVIEELKDRYRILTYHRLGYGKSAEYKCSRTISNIVLELEGLLQELNIDEKFILMGHSFGGLVAQYFAMRNEDKLNGLILVDSTSRNFKRLESVKTPVFNKLMSIETLTDGWMKIYEKDQDEFLKDMVDVRNNVEDYLSQEDKDEKIDFNLDQRIFRSLSHEMRGFEESAQELSNILRKIDTPLYILARDEAESVKNFMKYELPGDEGEIFEEIWRALQEELCDISNRTSFKVAEGSDHCIMEEKPEYVVKAVEDIGGKLDGII